MGDGDRDRPADCRDNHTSFAVNMHRYIKIRTGYERMRDLRPGRRCNQGLKWGISAGLVIRAGPVETAIDGFFKYLCCASTLRSPGASLF